MKKLMLSLDALEVESFDTAGDRARGGTVHAHDLSLNGGWTCNDSCIETGCDTCDNSLDYCTCADCPVHTDFCPIDTRGTTCRCQ